MDNALTIKIVDLKQYNKEDKTINYYDPTQSRWQEPNGIYTKIKQGYNLIAIPETKIGRIFVGKISAIEKEKNIIHCINIKEIECTIEKLLSIHSFNSKFVQIKGNFKPFSVEVNIEKINKDITEKNFSKFYITKISIYEKLNKENKFEDNDRIAIINKNNEVEYIKIYTSNKELKYMDNYPSFKAITINEIKEKNKNKKNNSIEINNMLKHIKDENYGFHEFKNFNKFYNTLINEKTLHRTSKKIKNSNKPNNELENYTKSDIAIKEQPLNQILYGPPGTGKTYETQLLKESILEKQIEHINTENIFDSEKIKNIIKDLTWYEIIALTIYKFSKNKNITVSELSQFEYIQHYYSMKDCKQLNNTLWAQLQIHTSHECLNVQYSNRQEPFLFVKDNNSKWSLTESGISYVEETLKDVLYKLETRKDINIDFYNKFFKFITFHQSYSYEDFIESIKPDLDSNDIKYVHKNGIFKQLCLQANKDKDNKYLLVIDEINRGNISKIFGELITLIEEDKRVKPNGEDNFDNIKIEGNSLLATLPYSNEKFGVPENLYIIGTMNTSDRSIASVDIALRRRFKFIEKIPKKHLVSTIDINGTNFQLIFEALNEKITILLDRDHQIGHSYFMPEKVEKYGLKNIWFDEILPLLNEYFYNDWEKLQDLLGKATNDNSSFIKVKEYNYEFINDNTDEKEIFNFVDKDIDDNKFKAALSKILKDDKKETDNNDN